MTSKNHKKPCKSINVNEHILTVVRTLRTVSICHLLFGAYFSATVIIFEVVYCLNSGSQFSTKLSISFIMLRMLVELIRAKDNSTARLK